MKRVAITAGIIAVLALAGPAAWAADLIEVELLLESFDGCGCMPLNPPACDVCEDLDGNGCNVHEGTTNNPHPSCPFDSSGPWPHPNMDYYGPQAIDDDWVNVPFISPAIFRQFVAPAYRLVQDNEGPANHFHTCGIIVPIIADLLAALPHIRWLDVSGWNDFEALDRLVDPAIGFGMGFINSFVLAGSPDEHRDKLRRIAAVRKRRTVSLCAQAIVRLHDDFAVDLGRMNRFIELARQELAE